MKYDKIISIHHNTLISETMTRGKLIVRVVTVFGIKDEYCLDHKNTKNWRVIQYSLGMS
jgi:hypothetical protein